MPILIVEDDRNVAYLVQYHVRKLGHNDVTVVGNGSLAVEALETRSWNLVLLDWMLPDISGMEVLQHMRSGSVNAATPVVMMTARSNPEDVLAAIEAGASDYVVKPFDRAVLQSKILKYMKSFD